MKRVTDTTYRRRVLFEEILSAQLNTSELLVDAFYESGPRTRVMRTCCVDGHTVQVGINLSFEEEAIFAGCTDAAGLTTAFRALFIAQYMRCLETAKTTVPSSLFAGWVTVDAVGDVFTGEKRAVYLPDAFGKNKWLRPIDVHCAIRAMTAVTMTYDTFLSDEAKQRAERYIETLITYTGMPDVMYEGSVHPCYTAVCEAKRLTMLIEAHPDMVRECTALRNASCDDVARLLDACGEAGDAFLPAMIVRLSAMAGEGWTEHPVFARSYAVFCENCAAFCSETGRKSRLLRDTRRAVQQLVGGTQQWNVEPRSGGVHYIR